MPQPHTFAPPSPTGGPTAIGFVRVEVSGSHAARHADEIQRHACGSGYRYAYTVRPPADEKDPIGYVLGVAAGLAVEVIVAFDLRHVNDRPALICDAGYDLETVSPQCKWARSAAHEPSVGAGSRMLDSGAVLAPPGICGCADVDVAHEQMRRHRECRIEGCAWKWAAYYTLIHFGRIAPQALSPRERAHRRGIEFPATSTSSPCAAEPSAVRPARNAPELQTLRRVLDGLTRDTRVRSRENHEG